MGTWILNAQKKAYNLANLLEGHFLFIYLSYVVILSLVCGALRDSNV